MLTHNHVAILEAKPQFQCLQDSRSILSDESFAQMVCEALAARLSYPSIALQQSVIIINATQHYICFLQVDLRDEYVDDLESPSPEHMLYISSTPWFDLDRRNGRESVLANLCGIMRRAKSV
ncbi:hypothetical protein BO86DRAFT_206181 [Aspergillus japonicus CBS 114.51]|uniref:Uncharacterized protein n=1 Tax=Aspergillus japonicus CBS 114.51 TaxID=1448312 RepID=A0A8T8WPM3_ASPJA|nr:hypothetical protein BO86DRAFT_206181 [Aspergillus japonicus CBS 114.51]RAH77795.1 hypothetical protein BO86DRAFT_206181 [Aspergillus japonicus CBS 114.51]